MGLGPRCSILNGERGEAEGADFAAATLRAGCLGVAVPEMEGGAVGGVVGAVLAAAPLRAGLGPTSLTCSREAALTMTGEVVSRRAVGREAGGPLVVGRGAMVVGSLTGWMK